MNFHRGTNSFDLYYRPSYRGEILNPEDVVILAISTGNNENTSSRSPKAKAGDSNVVKSPSSAINLFQLMLGSYSHLDFWG